MEYDRETRLDTAGLFLIPGVGRADLVTYFISGKVGVITDTSPNHYVPTSITPNVSDFIGSFTFDNSAPGTGGAYRGTALQLSAHITIDGKYDYIINSPTANDEIDIFGTSFGLYLRGPTVALNFAPNPPFSHFEFQGTTQTTILSQVVLGPTGTAGVSDQQTPDDFYYFIGTNTSTVVATPEPTSLALVGVFAGGLLFKRWRKTQGEFPATPSPSRGASAT